MDLVIRGATAALSNTMSQLDIGVRDGRVAALGEPGSLRGDSEFSAAGMLALPGAVDVHVHFREPGFIHKEDFSTGSQAAACGGVTFVCDMPNTDPPVIDAATFRDKVGVIGSGSWVDFGLWAGGTQTSEFAGMADAGAAGLKVYMAMSSQRPDPLYFGDEASLFEILRASAELRWPVSVHVGNQAISDGEQAELVAAGRRDPAAYLALNRGAAPLDGLRKVMDLARLTGARLNIAHVSAFGPAALDAIRAFREAGGVISAEIPLPVLGESEIDRWGIFALPYALPAAEHAYFWTALGAGDIDILATDHAPHTRSEKQPGLADVWAAPAGFPSVEVQYPLAISAVLEGRLEMHRLLRSASWNPARLLGLERKGAISVGRDADLVLVDPEADLVISAARLHSKVGWSPFEGRRVRGRIAATFLRGRLVARDGEIVGDRATGQMAGFARPRDPEHPVQD